MGPVKFRLMINCGIGCRACCSGSFSPACKIFVFGGRQEARSGAGIRPAREEAIGQAGKDLRQQSAGANPQRHCRKAGKTKKMVTAGSADCPQVLGADAKANRSRPVPACPSDCCRSCSQSEWPNPSAGPRRGCVGEGKILVAGVPEAHFFAIPGCCCFFRFFGPICFLLGSEFVVLVKKN